MYILHKVAPMPHQKRRKHSRHRHRKSERSELQAKSVGKNDIPDQLEAQSDKASEEPATAWEGVRSRILSMNSKSPRRQKSSRNYLADTSYFDFATQSEINETSRDMVATPASSNQTQLSSQLSICRELSRASTSLSNTSKRAASREMYVTKLMPKVVYTNLKWFRANEKQASQHCSEKKLDALSSMVRVDEFSKMRYPKRQLQRRRSSLSDNAYQYTASHSRDSQAEN